MQVDPKEIGPGIIRGGDYRWMGAKGAVRGATNNIIEEKRRR